MVQELRGADGKLYGVLREGRWLEIRRGERLVQFDLSVFALVAPPVERVEERLGDRQGTDATTVVLALSGCQW